MRTKPSAKYQLRSQGPIKSNLPAETEQGTSTMNGQEVQAVSGRPPFNIDLVGKFDPAINEAKSWLSRFMYIGTVTETSPNILARFFGMFLSMGVAFDWYTYLSDEAKENFDCLKEKFI